MIFLKRKSRSYWTSPLRHKSNLKGTNFVLSTAVVMKNVFGISCIISSGQSVAVANVGGGTPPLRDCSRVAVPLVSAAPRAATQSNLHFFPDAAFLLPVVERFAVDLVNGGFRDIQLAPLDSHEEINVVKFAVGTFHVDACKIFVPAQAREAIIVNFDEVQREILPVVRHVKFLVGRFR